MRLVYWRARTADVPRLLGDGVPRALAAGRACGAVASLVALAYLQRSLPALPRRRPRPGPADPGFAGLAASPSWPLRSSRSSSSAASSSGAAALARAGLRALASAAIFALVHPRPRDRSRVRHGGVRRAGLRADQDARRTDDGARDLQCGRCWMAVERDIRVTRPDLWSRDPDLMSIVNSIRSQLAPIHPEGYPVHRRLRAREPGAVLVLDAARLARHGADALVRVFLPRPAARDPDRRRPRHFAGRRPRQPRRQCGAAAGTCARHDAAAARLGLHERVRLPCEPRAGERADRAHRLHAGKIPQCRPRQGERGQ